MSRPKNHTKNQQLYIIVINLHFIGGTTGKFWNLLTNSRHPNCLQNQKNQILLIAMINTCKYMYNLLPVYSQMIRRSGEQVSLTVTLYYHPLHVSVKPIVNQTMTIILYSYTRMQTYRQEDCHIPKISDPIFVKPLPAQIQQLISMICGSGNKNKNKNKTLVHWNLQQRYL